MARRSKVPALQPAAAPPSVTPVATDLLDTRSMVVITKRAVEATETAISDWARVQPLVEGVVDLLETTLDAAKAQATPPPLKEQRENLATISKTLELLARTATQFSKLSDENARLVLLLTGGPPKRDAPERMSERQMAKVVIEAAKVLAKEGSHCPVCGSSSAIIGEVVMEAEAASTE